MTFSNYIFDITAPGFQPDEILFDSVTLNTQKDDGVEFISKIEWKLLKKAPTTWDQYKDFAHMYQYEYFRFININYYLMSPCRKSLSMKYYLPSYFYLNLEFILEDVKFVTISSIVSEIGGAASFLRVLFLILFSYGINQHWVRSIRKEIKRIDGP